MENLFQMHMDRSQIDRFSNLALAHIGDCVFELLSRSYLFTRGVCTVDRLHRETIRLVNAPAQAAFAEKMLPLLNETELSYYRRGKNAHVHAVPKGATPSEYARATGVEALFGYLHLSGQDARANEIFHIVTEEHHGL